MTKVGVMATACAETIPIEPTLHSRRGFAGNRNQRTISTDKMRNEALSCAGFPRSAASANCSMPM